jgi:MFS transporter, DHA1 family, multidrug resistance protein
LTLSVYIGSAIYTAGLQGVAEHFGVSEVAALLGLTVFVLGYAIGPMVLVLLYLVCLQYLQSLIS